MASASATNRPTLCSSRIPLPPRNSRAYLPMFKRYAQFAGETCDPMVIHWPKGIKAKGQVRHQYHATDIVPTILDVAGLQRQESLVLCPRRCRDVTVTPIT